MPKKKHNRKNNRKVQSQKRKESVLHVKTKNEPHCVVLTRGGVALDLKKLSKDYQRMMEPNVPSKLQGSRKNTVKDFLAVAAQLSLTHIIVFTQTSKGMYVKFARIPQGPTVTFKIMNYTRTKDVLASLKKQYTHFDQFMFSPCIMTNIQPNEGDLHLQVTARMFLDMFPNITPAQAATEKIRRCCLFHYDEENDLFDLRHYSIRTVPVELCKGLKKMMGRKVPDLGRFTDVSEFITKAGLLSDSEAEDDPNARVTVPHKKSRGVALKSSVRLNELGPRMSLKIYKVEGGLLQGQVLYHSFVIKTAEEKVLLEELSRKRKNMREKRKKQQEQNIEEKKKKKEQHKKRCLVGMKMEKEETKSMKDQMGDQGDADDEDDDAEYYREEVGEEPDPDLFRKKRKRDGKNGVPRKKFKGNSKEIMKAQKNERPFRTADDLLSDESYRGGRKKRKWLKDVRSEKQARARMQ